MLKGKGRRWWPFKSSSEGYLGDPGPLSQVDERLKVGPIEFDVDKYDVAPKGYRFSPPVDDLVWNLRSILEDPANLSDDALDAGCMDTEKLMEDLIIYLEARDHRILQHGIKLGKEASK